MERINLSKINLIEEKNSISITHRKLQFALLFYIFLRLIFFSRVSAAHVAKYSILIVVIVATSVLTEFIYYRFFNNISTKDAFKIIKITNPQTVGLSVACAVNCGYDLLPIIICTALSIILTRIFFGGYTNNIFNTFAFTMVLMFSCFTNTINTAQLDGNLNTFLLNLFNVTESLTTREVANLQDILISESLPYISFGFISTVAIALIYFLIIFKYLKADVTILLRTLLFLFLLCYCFVGYFNGTSHLNTNSDQFSDFFKYSLNITGVFGHFYKTFVLLFYMLYGATVIGVILCTVFTNTIPKSNVNKYIVAFILALLTFYTKIFSYNPFGYFYAIIIINAITPMLDNVMSNDKNIKNIIVVSLVLLSLIIGFLCFQLAMSGG